MGLFLQAAIALSHSAGAIRQYIRELPEQQLQSWDFFMEQCRWTTQNGSAVLVFESSAYEDFAKTLSRKTGGAVMLLYIYDGDFWGYYLYDGGQPVDQFCPLPDYFSEVSEEERRMQAGNAALVAKYFGVDEECISEYLVQWDEVCDPECFAYPDDEFPREDWQMTDFMRRLGFFFPETADGEVSQTVRFDENDEEADRETAVWEAQEGLKWLAVRYRIKLPILYERCFEDWAAMLGDGANDQKLISIPEGVAVLEEIIEDILQVGRRFSEDRRLFPFASAAEGEYFLLDYGPETTDDPAVILYKAEDRSFWKAFENFDKYSSVCQSDLENCCGERYEYDLPMKADLNKLVKIRVAADGVMEEQPVENATLIQLETLVDAALSGRRNGLELTFQMQGEGMYIKRLKKTVYKPFYRTAVLYHLEDQLVCLCFNDDKHTCHQLISDYTIYSGVESRLVRDLPLGGAAFPEYIVHTENGLARRELMLLILCMDCPEILWERRRIWAPMLCYPNFNRYFELKEGWSIEKVFPAEL